MKNKFGNIRFNQYGDRKGSKKYYDVIIECIICRCRFEGNHE